MQKLLLCIKSWLFLKSDWVHSEQYILGHLCLRSLHEVHTVSQPQKLYTLYLLPPSDSFSGGK